MQVRSTGRRYWSDARSFLTDANHTTGSFLAENAQNEKSDFSLKRFGRIKAKLGQQPTQNTAGRKRVGQENVDSDYLCGDCLQRRTYEVDGFGQSTREFCLETWSGGRVVSGNTRSLVEPDNSTPAVMLVGFAPLGATVMLLPAEVAAEGRLGL